MYFFFFSHPYIILSSQPRHFIPRLFIYIILTSIFMHTTLYYSIFIANDTTSWTYLIEIFNKKLIKYAILMIKTSFSTRKTKYILSTDFRLEAQTLSSAILLNPVNLGTATAAMIPSIAITTINSTNSKYIRFYIHCSHHNN